MKRNPWIQKTILPLCVVIAAQHFAMGPVAQGQDSPGAGNNPLFAELAKARFVEHTPDEVREEIQGKKLVGLYFTSQWCVACRFFTPKLIKLRDANPDEFQFVMVSWDKSLKNEQAYLAKSKMNVPAIRFDDPLVQEYNERYQIDGIPTLLVFDEDGKLITARGWECMSWTLRPGMLEQVGEGESALAWRKMVAPFQEELQAKRLADLEVMKPVIEEYKDFPHMDEIAGWLGYYGASETIKEIMHKVGKEMVADWENRKHHLDYFADLAIKLKPKPEGYIGVIEGPCGSGLFEELGKEV